MFFSARAECHPLSSPPTPESKAYAGKSITGTITRYLPQGKGVGDAEESTKFSALNPAVLPMHTCLDDWSCQEPPHQN